MDKTTLQIVITARDEVSAELKKVQKDLKKVSDELRNMQKTGSTSARRTARDLKKIGNEGLEAKEKVKKLVGTLQGLGALRLFSAIGIGLFVRQLGVALNNLSKEFVEFENEMRRVNTITRLVGAEFDNMTKGVAALSTIVPKTSKELASGLFDIASAGVKAGDQMAFLGVSAKLATAGFFDTATAVQGLTAVIKGYGLEFNEAERIADLFFKTNELGQTTVAEIALSIQELTANANASGVGVEQLFTIFGTFTGVTGNAARVATQFKGALNALAKPTKEVKALVKVLNESLVAAGKDEIQLGRNIFVTKNFAEVSRDLFEALDGDVEALRRIIPEVEATNLIIAAATSEFDNFNTKILETLDSVGSYQRGFEEAMLSTLNQTKLATAELKFFFFELALGTAELKLSFAKGLVTGLFEFQKALNLTRAGFRDFVSSVLGGVLSIREFLNDTFGLDLDTSGLTDKIAEFDADVERLLDNFDKLEKRQAGGSAVFAEFTKREEEIAKIMNEIRKSFDLDALSGGGQDKGIKGLLKVFQKVNSTLQKFADEFEDAEQVGIRSMAKLQVESFKNIGKIDQDIKKVTQSLADLQTQFNKQKGGDVRSLAESFADAGKRIEALKEELIRATDIQQIFDIKTQIGLEEKALEDTKDVRAKFATEIAEAQRRAGLSELGRAIEDFETRRNLAQEEFNDKQSKLQAERNALFSKRKLEQDAFLQAQAEAKIDLEDSLANITKEKNAFVAKVEAELRLEEDKSEAIKQLFKEASDFRQQTVQDSSNAIQGTLEAEVQLWNRLANSIARATGSRTFGGFTASPIPSGSFETGGTVPQTGLFTLHQGETVLTRRESRARGGITVHIQGGTFLSEEAAEQMGDLIIDKLKTNTRI